jgi:hypothetical protein
MAILTKEEAKQRYQELMVAYVSAKPLLNDVYKRNGNEQTDAILNEIRAINDHVARFNDESRKEEERNDELIKAEGHLKRMVYDAYKQLNIFFYDSTNDFEKANFGVHWLHLNKGNFWLEYIQKRKAITDIVKEAKEQESISTEAAFKSFEKAYVEQRNVYKLIEDNRQELVLTKKARRLYWLNSQKGWATSTVILAIVPAMIWELTKHFSELWVFVKTIATELFRSFCEWGLSTVV